MDVNDLYAYVKLYVSLVILEQMPIYDSNDFEVGCKRLFWAFKCIFSIYTKNIFVVYLDKNSTICL